MSIWHNPAVDLAMLRRVFPGAHMDSHLGIEYTELGADFVRARMPVDARTRQPFGLLHGGASVVLAESLGSVGANLTLDPASKYAVGIAINANHLRSIREGWVIGTARPVHRGSSTQVWEVRITDESDRPVCVSRITLAVLERRSGRRDFRQEP